MQGLLIARSPKIPGLIILGILCLTVMCNGAPAYDKTSPKEKILLRYRAKGNEELCYLVSTKRVGGDDMLPITDLWLVSLTKDKQGIFCIWQRSERLMAPTRRLFDDKEKELYHIASDSVNRARDISPGDEQPIRFRSNLGIPHEHVPGFFTPAWIPVLPQNRVRVNDEWRKKVTMHVAMGRGLDVVAKRLDIPVECKLTAIEILEGTETKCAVIEYGYEATGRESDFNPKWLSTWRIKCSGRAWFAIGRGIVFKKVETYELAKDFDKSPPEGDFFVKRAYEATLLNMYCPKARQAIPSAHGRNKAKGAPK